MFKFDLQLFGGMFGGDDSSQTTTTERNIPAQSANEAELEFQFTGLIRGPTHLLGYVKTFGVISIHRPHTRPDPFQHLQAV